MSLRSTEHSCLISTPRYFLKIYCGFPTIEFKFYHRTQTEDGFFKHERASKSLLFIHTD